MLDPWLNLDEMVFSWMVALVQLVGLLAVWFVCRLVVIHHQRKSRWLVRRID